MKNFIIIMILFFATYVPLFQIASPQLKKFIGLRFVVCVALATLAGFIMPNVPMFYAALVALFITTVRNRLDALCRYILLIALIPSIRLPINIQGHFLGYTDSAAVIGITAYLYAIFSKKNTDQKSIKSLTNEDYLVFTIFLIMAIGTAGLNQAFDSARAIISHLMLTVLPYLLFRSALTNKLEYRTLIACFGFASVFLAVFAIYEARFHWSIFEGIQSHLGIIAISKNILVRGGLLRASATMQGPLALACFMTFGILALACSRDFFTNSVGYYGSLAVALLGLLASQSRGSIIALIASTIVLSFALRKRILGTVILGSTVALALTLKLLSQIYPPLASFISGGAPTAHGQYYDYRNLLLERGLQEVARHPFIGVRLTDVYAALADIKQGEHIVDLVNIYLVILLISGFVGLLPFLALTLRSGVRATVRFKKINDHSLLLARGFCLSAFTVVLIQFSFVSYIDRIPMNFVLILCGIRLLVFERQSMHRTATRVPVRGPPSLPTDALAMADDGIAYPTRLGHDAL